LANVIKVSGAVRIPIIGIGGITTGEDVLEFLIAGATAVQLGTVNFMNPLALYGMLDFISDYLNQQGIDSISQLIGSLQK